MEDDADPKAAPSELTKLEHLQQEDASILALLRILLSVSTLPHVVTIIVLSSVLQIATVSGFESMSAMGFVALAGGYFLTGLLAGRPTVDRWIRLIEREGDERSTLSSLVLSDMPLPAGDVGSGVCFTGRTVWGKGGGRRFNLGSAVGPFLVFCCMGHRSGPRLRSVVEFSFCIKTTGR